MCGIVGIWNAQSGRWADEKNILDGMLRLVEHRGPDEKGTFRSGSAEIGIRRLNIIDLETGSQPIDNGIGNKPPSLYIVFNGELFNYIEIRAELKGFGVDFKTQSDTEVVLRAYEYWGPECLRRFIGQWAFCILHLDQNGNPEKMFLCRDRMGEKPLYYYHKNGRFLFASEIKALLPYVDTAPAIGDEFWAFEAPAEGLTLFQDIKELPSAHYMTFDGENLRFCHYWQITDEDHRLDKNEGDLIEELRGLLRSAILLRLRSDVPVGIALSGGVDSAAIACIAEPDATFSCRFELGPQFDEFKYAEIVARHLGCKQYVVSPDHDDFRKKIGRIVWHLDQPVATASPIGDFAVSELARDKGMKVLLGGQGSDECFGGYTRYLVYLSEYRLSQSPELAHYHSMMRYFWGSDELFGDPAARYFKLLCRGNCKRPDQHAQTVGRHFRKWKDIVDAMGYTDLQLTLPALITMNDRSSAAVGVENRNPFLDHRLVEFAFRLPPDMKIREFTTKYLLKKSLRGIVPDPVLDRRDKKGLVVPFVPWMKKGGPLGPWAEQLVEDLGRRIDLPENLHRRGEFDRSTYTLVTLELWFREFFPDYRESGVIN